MIEDKDTARQVSELMIEVGRRLNDSVALVQGTSSDEDFGAYRTVIASLLGTMLVDVMNPLYAKHPDLKPDELK